MSVGSGADAMHCVKLHFDQTDPGAFPEDLPEPAYVDLRRLLSLPSLNRF